VHVLPTGGDRPQPGLAQFRYRDKTRVGQSIERAYVASASYLAELARLGRARPVGILSLAASHHGLLRDPG